MGFLGLFGALKCPQMSSKKNIFFSAGGHFELAFKMRGMQEYVEESTIVEDVLYRRIEQMFCGKAILNNYLITYGVTGDLGESEPSHWTCRERKSRVRRIFFLDMSC